MCTRFSLFRKLIGTCKSYVYRVSLFFFRLFAPLKVLYAISLLCEAKKRPFNALEMILVYTNVKLNLEQERKQERKR